MKINGCANCHQLGTLATAHRSRQCAAPLGSFANSEEAWFRRLQSGQGGETMFDTPVKELGAAPLRYLADWTDRIAKGELPHAKPPRPQGVERNIVVTTWDWLDDKHYLHDLIASDRRFPRLTPTARLWFDRAQHRYHSDSRSHKQQRQKLSGTRARRRYAYCDWTKLCGTDKVYNRRLIGATSGFGLARRAIITACSIAKAASGSPRPCVRPNNPDFLQKGLGPSFGESVSD